MRVCLLRAIVWTLAAVASVSWGAVSAAAQSEVVHYYHTDGIGSVRAVTDQTGQVISRHEYQPFGEEYLPPPGSDERIRFAGKELDPETGSGGWMPLNYFGARYLHSASGRFTAVDPVVDISGSIGNPQKWNRYAYVTNSPLRFIDPDGRIPIAIPVVVAIAWYLYEAQLNAPAEGAELVDDVTEIDMLGAVMDGEDVASMGAIGLLRRGGKAGLKMLRRFDGPKPKYTVNPAHVPGRGLRAGKTPLPDDADDVYRNAVPNDPDKPTAWFGKNSDGEIYRYSPGNDGTVHFSGSGSELGNLTTYAKQRLESR